jgi:hypothetical protein
MRKPTLNLNQFGNKFDCVVAARDAGVPTPDSIPVTRDTVLQGRAGITGNWITKPYYSLGGRDINRWTQGTDVPSTHYLQQDLSSTRRYEVRVHAMAWVRPENWIMQKRVHEDGENQLTWNHHTGGRFETINDTSDPLFVRIRESAQTLMGVLGYQFGAVDFIVCNAGERGRPLPHYFIEWNLSPGWTLDHIRDYYINSFRALTQLDMDTVTEMLEGGMLSAPVEASEAQAPRGEVQRNRPEDIEIPTLDEIPEQSEPEPHAAQESIEDLREFNLQENIEELRRLMDRASIEQPVEVVSSNIPEPEVDDSARYAAALGDMSDSMNFCPQCGRSVNTDIFGAMPRFCPGCGSQVRA